jgi:hypothetical protein
VPARARVARSRDATSSRDARDAADALDLVDDGDDAVVEGAVPDVVGDHLEVPARDRVPVDGRQQPLGFADGEADARRVVARLDLDGRALGDVDRVDPLERLVEAPRRLGRRAGLGRVPVRPVEAPVGDHVAAEPEDDAVELAGRRRLEGERLAVLDGQRRVDVVRAEVEREDLDRVREERDAARLALDAALEVEVLVPRAPAVPGGGGPEFMEMWCGGKG